MIPLLPGALAILLASGALPGRGEGRGEADLLRLARPALRVYTDHDGLPENSIFDVEIDRRGYLWVATENGVASYNGRVWTSLPPPPGEGAGFARDLLAASDGSLWLGMDRRGLFRLRNGQWTVYQTAGGFPSDAISRVLETRDEAGRSTVWVATVGAGLIRFEGESWTRFGSEAGLGDERVTALQPATSASGEPAFWVGTQSGVTRFEGGRFAPGPLEAPGAPRSQVRDVAEVGPPDARALWVALDTEGLAVFASGAWTRSEIPHARLTALLATGSPADPTVYVGTYGRGMGRFERGRWDVLDKDWGLPSDSIRCLRETVSPDGIRTLWIGTQGGGLVRVTNQGWRTIDRRLGLPSDFAGPIAETQGRRGERSLWIGTNRGLARLRGDGWTIYDRKDGLPSEDVTALSAVTGPSPILWVGLIGGVARFQDERWTFWGPESGIPRQSITALATSRGADGREVVWAGTYGNGLLRFDGDAWTVLDPQTGFRNQVASLLPSRGRDGQSILWVGSHRRGLSRFEDGVWHYPGTIAKPPSDSVQCLLEVVGSDGHRRLWYGARGGGGPFSLDLDDPDAAWIDVSRLVRSPLPSTVIELQRDAEGRIYAFTTTGIARLTPRTPTPEDPSAWSVVLFKTSDGLPSDRCNYRGAYVDHAGRVWAGTLGGVAVLDPATEIEDRTPKPLYVERATAGSDGHPIAPGAALGFRENRVRLSLALLSTHREVETRFRTQLEGFDREPTGWTGEGVREFTNLPPGRYVFRAWARDWAGNVSGPVEFPLRVEAAPWRSWWAVLLYVGVGALGVHALVRSRTGRLRRQTAFLEVRVEERTAELKASEARARDASQAKGVFLANMSHELRTPLNAILGFAQLMAREDERSQRDRERLAVINRSGQHLLGMINDVLSFARIEAGRLTLDPQPFDLHRTLANVEEMMRLRAETQGLELLVELAPGIPRFTLGDEGKLRQVLVNLAGNALKFTPRGRVTLRAAWAEGRATFEVEDTGPGIPPEDQARIFQAFAQTAVGRQSAEGTGLGLAITANLVALMGGTISVDSAPGRGSRFRFDAALPEAVGAEPVTPRRVRSLAPGEPEWRILVADDTDENRNLLGELLTSVGFTVREVSDGSAAIGEWVRFRPHAIFMDARMPGMDGHAATREIRRREEEARADGARTLIVALTASAFAHDRDAMLAVGCDEFVPKPFAEGVLWEILERRLGLRFDRSATEAEALPGPAAAPAPAELGALPSAWRSALAAALTRGDVAEAEQLVDQLPADQGRIALKIREMLRGFRIDELLDQLEAAAAP